MTRILLLLLATAAVSAFPSQAYAQANRSGTVQDTAAARRAAEQQLGRSVSQDEIIERLRRSGMSRSEVRARLQQAGYPSGLADAYFDAMERGDSPGGRPDSTLVSALQRIGVRARATGAASDTMLNARGREFGREPLDSMLLQDSVPRELEVFGLRTFRQASSQFIPPSYGPVDPGYRLGPGDELLLILTGDVEQAYPLDVTREGFVFIPHVGQVSVNGLTLAQLEDVLYNRLGRVYSSVSRSAGATTRFQLSMGALRTNQVLVTGDVVRPGAYQVSSVSGLFHALYQAGGPTETGSFRHIEVHRGGSVAHVADLYDFLVRGSGAGDVRLEHNDRIFVPPAGIQARVEGSVRRPAIYEARAGEDIRDLIAFAGGLRADALLRRVQIDRVVPPSDQRPGFYRTLVDVDLGRLMPGAPATAVVDGDIVHVFGVSDQRRNRVWVEGEVRNPGLYEWSRASTLWSALERADGLAEQAYTARAHIYRLDEQNGVRRLLQANLGRDASGTPLHDVPLMDNDSIVVLSRFDLRTPEFVTIDGFVKNPDTYPLARGMTLKDLILTAGGFEEGAFVLEAELARSTDPLSRSDTTAYVARIPLTMGRPENDGNGGFTAANRAIPDWVPEAEDVMLLAGDRVFVRRAPGYEPVRQVRLAGQVVTPGTYVLARRGERLADVLERAGGVTPQAFPAGMHIVRSGRIVAADLQRALRDPRDHNNVLLMEGDSIHVPAYDPMVVVAGAVSFEARVLYVPGKGADYYVNQAGGVQPSADRRRATITYANGQRALLRRGALVSSAVRVEPGSQIFIPERAEQRGTNWDLILGRSVTLISAAATAIIAYSQLR